MNEKWVHLATAPDQITAEIWVSILHDNGIAAFVLSAATGSLFIFGQPDQYFYNAAFKFKVVALLLLGLNVSLFYTLEARRVLALGPNDDVPLRAKIIAATSLTLLVSIILFGRMLTFFRP